MLSLRAGGVNDRLGSNPSSHSRRRKNRMDSGVLVQMLALGLASVLASEPSAALQLGHDQIDELLDRAGAVDRRQHEAIAADEIEIGLELVGDVGGRADDLRQADALTVVLRHLPQG